MTRLTTLSVRIWAVISLLMLENGTVWYSSLLYDPCEIKLPRSLLYIKLCLASPSVLRYLFLLVLTIMWAGLVTF